MATATRSAPASWSSVRTRAMSTRSRCARTGGGSDSLAHSWRTPLRMRGPTAPPGATSRPTRAPERSASTSGSAWWSPAPGCTAPSTYATRVRLAAMTILDDARAGMDASIRPQDDLFGHVNGRWLAEEEIPSDRSSWGAFAVIAETAEQQVRAIIEECAAASATAEKGSPTQQIGDLWKSFMDSDRVEELGAAPVAADLERLAAVSDHDQLASFIGGFERRGGGGFFRSYVDTDDRNSDRYVVNLVQGGLGLPDESYYREDKFQAIRDAYLAYLGRMLALAGLDDG